MTRSIFKNLGLHGETFRFDRRQFNRLCSATAVTLPFAGNALGQMAQNGTCQRIVNDLAGAVDDPNLHNLLYYFIDGVHFNERSNIPSRANLAFFIGEKQTAERYVERVVLADPANHVLGVRFFDADDKMADGYVPYVTFENVALDFRAKYYIYYQIRQGSEVMLKRFELANAHRSVLNGLFLPQVMADDFNDFQRIITSPFQFYTTAPLSAHTARGYIRDIGSDNSFSIDVDFMHADLDASHYMRYFFVTDPVGRILGVLKRGHAGLDNQAINPVGLPPDAQITSSSTVNTSNAAHTNGQVNLRNPGTAEIERLGILSDLHVAKINDCPYIYVYTEDHYDAMARTCIRLR